MAVGNFIFFLITALVAVNLIFAESQPPPPPPGSDHQGAPPEGGPNQDPNERFFFWRLRGCNYTATPGATCLSCTTASTCLPSNVGVLRVCRGFFPYCNAGRCSYVAQTNCTALG